MKKHHHRAHGKPAGTKNIRPGTKHHSAGLGKPSHPSEKAFNRTMEGLEGEHRSIYANPYSTNGSKKRRDRRLTDKPL
jgi:hypothetical protein